LTKNEIRIC